MSRLTPLAGPLFDVVVVGGGIIGAGVARDAALRGLRTALVEAADFGGGTTAGSTRLIHGGLRYLEMFDLPLVRLDLREREILLRIARHLVQPLEFVLPFYDETLWSRWRLRIGMALYDALSFDKSLPRHRILSADELREREPMLEPRGLQGGAVYYDAQASLPERLCLENVIDARRLGAEVANYAPAVRALLDGSRIAGVAVEDGLTGEVVDVRARTVVNASGAWLDRVSHALTGPSASRLRTTKGIHLACPPTTTRAVALASAIDGRLVFVIPWLGYTWIGTTDTDFTDDPRLARANRADVEYLIGSVAPYVPVRHDAIHFTNAGVRALVRQPGHESAVSRSHKVVDGREAGADGLVAVVGGKLTGYRAIAKEATDLVCRRIGVRARCATADRLLPGAGPELRDGSGAAPPAAHLTSLYGSRGAEVEALARREPALAARLDAAYPDIAAQVPFAVREESCLRLVDFMWRRTRLAFTPDQGRAAAARAADLLAGELGWSEAQREREIAEYQASIDRTQAYRQDPDPSPGPGGQR